MLHAATTSRNCNDRYHRQKTWDDPGVQRPRGADPCHGRGAPPNPVVKVTEKAAAGFASVELGYGQQRTARPSKKGEGKPRGRRASRAEIGHAKKAGLDYAPRVLRS